MDPRWRKTFTPYTRRAKGHALGSCQGRARRVRPQQAEPGGPRFLGREAEAELVTPREPLSRPLQALAAELHATQGGVPAPPESILPHLGELIAALPEEDQRTLAVHFLEQVSASGDCNWPVHEVRQLLRAGHDREVWIRCQTSIMCQSPAPVPVFSRRLAAIMLSLIAMGPSLRTEIETSEAASRTGAEAGWMAFLGSLSWPNVFRHVVNGGVSQSSIVTELMRRLAT